MNGPAELALVTELEVPAAKLALFQTACFNPTIPGTQPQQLWRSQPRWSQNCMPACAASL